MEVGTKIKKLRYKASLTQEQLAERLGVSPQSVSKWENSITLPDITMLPELAEVFGVSIDELFDLTADQKLRRIESRMESEDELEPDIFREYEEFLKENIGSAEYGKRAVSLLAELYHHKIESDSKKAAYYAKQAIMDSPGEKDCQWILDRAEGGQPWDWNIANHCRIIDFYKEVIEKDKSDPKSPLPYYYLIDNLIADHRTEEAADYLRRFAVLPGHNPIMIPVYEAAIALASYDEKKADAIMEKALADHPDDTGLLFEEAQYYARKCDYAKAVGFYEAGYSAEEGKKPRYTDALDAMSMIFEITGDYEKAAETQKRKLRSLKEEWGMTEEAAVSDTEKEIERLMKKLR